MKTHELAARARKGDAEAFSVLISAKKHDLYRIAYSYTRNEQVALDVVSDAVYKAFVSVHKLKKPEFFYTWLTRILINSAANHLKLAKRMVLVEEEPPVAAKPEGSPEEVMDLYAAIDKLEDKRKTVVLLKYVNDLTIEEVAEIMQCPVGTAKTHLHKALKDLRLELKED